MLKGKRIALNAALSALALTAFMLENLIPSFLPGARLGLSNVFVLAACLLLSPGEAYITLVVKCVLGAVFSGNPYSVVYSLPSGALSLATACLIAYGTGGISLTACGALCAVVNSAAQSAIFALTAQTARIFLYTPWLLLSSAFFGAVTGSLCLIALRRVEKTSLFLNKYK